MHLKGEQQSAALLRGDFELRSEQESLILPCCRLGQGMLPPSPSAARGSVGFDDQWDNAAVGAEQTLPAHSLPALDPFLRI